jgi:hypothetical protein
MFIFGEAGNVLIVSSLKTLFYLYSQVTLCLTLARTRTLFVLTSDAMLNTCENPDAMLNTCENPENPDFILFVLTSDAMLNTCENQACKAELIKKARAELVSALAFYL